MGNKARVFGSDRCPSLLFSRSSSPAQMGHTGLHVKQNLAVKANFHHCLWSFQTKHQKARLQGGVIFGAEHTHWPSGSTLSIILFQAENPSSRQERGFVPTLAWLPAPSIFKQPESWESPAFRSTPARTWECSGSELGFRTAYLGSMTAPCRE